MAVLTYEVEESGLPDASTTEEIEAAMALINSMNLAGQKSIKGKPAKPYRKLTPASVRVCKVVFDTVSSIGNYDASPIPLRALQVAAHAKDCYKSLEVWSDGGNEAILVGIDQISYDKQDHYLLAQWGIIRPFDELTATAVKLWRRKLCEHLAEMQEEVRRRLLAMEKADDDVVLTSDLPSVFWK